MSNEPRRTTYIHRLSASAHLSDHAFFRLYFVANCSTPKELAAFLGVHVKDVIRVQKEARKGGDIPAQWLLITLRKKSVHPDWIVSGYGSVDWVRVFEAETDAHGKSAQDTIDQDNTGQGSTGQHEDMSPVFESAHDRDALRRLSSFTLAQELARRLAHA